jgi:apolipoprotein N-acyltransferase
VRIDQVAGSVLDQLFGRMLRRVVLAVVFVALAIIALYHFTIAGTLALEQHFTAIEARLIVGGIYGFIALVCAICWLILGRPASARTPALAQHRDMQIAMLVEAVMLGYALSRRTPGSP